MDYTALLLDAMRETASVLEASPCPNKQYKPCPEAALDAFVAQPLHTKTSCDCLGNLDRNLFFVDHRVVMILLDVLGCASPLVLVAAVSLLLRVPQPCV